MAIEREIDQAIKYFEALLECEKKDCAECNFMDYEKGCSVNVLEKKNQRYNKLALAALRMTKNMAEPSEGRPNSNGASD